MRSKNVLLQLMFSAITNKLFRFSKIQQNFRNNLFQYIEPHEASRLSQAELLVIDEAAAIPLPLVKALISGPYMSFLSSTINGYEGTGRSLSLKLLKQLRQSSPSETGDNLALKSGHTLHEMTLDESIRYKNDDQVC